MTDEDFADLMRKKHDAENGYPLSIGAALSTVILTLLVIIMMMGMMIRSMQ